MNERFALITIAVLFFGFTVPLFSSAQDTALASSIYCPNLTQNQWFASCDENITSSSCLRHVTGAQVSALQRFLVEYYDLNPDEYISGFFGRKTRDNVRKFQCEKMSICSGDEATTGWGVVGPKTRTAIKDACGTTTNTYSQSTYYAQATYTTTTYAQSSYTANLSCTLDGATVAHGTSRTFYSQRTGSTSVCAAASASRTCTNGILSGSSSYLYSSCTTTPPANTTQPPTVSLTINNQASITLPPNTTFSVAWSSSNATSCNLTNAQGQTHSTPHNVSGSSEGAVPAAGTTFTYKLSCTNAGGTTTKTATVAGQTITASNVGACTYKGQSVPEGRTETVYYTLSNPPTSTAVVCDNGAWVFASGENICSTYDGYSVGDFGCSSFFGEAYLAVIPRHGKVPLTTTTRTLAGAGSAAGTCRPYSLSWGDGTTEQFPERVCPNGLSDYDTRTHSYSAAGSYSISYTNAAGKSNSANIRVDPAGTASTQNQSQLASALSALESALKAILNLLGQ